MGLTLSGLKSILNAQPSEAAVPKSGVELPPGKKGYEERLDAVAELPHRVDTHPLQYAYAFGYEALPGVEPPRELLAGEPRRVDLREENDRILLSFEGADFAYIENPYKAQMLRDFQSQALPVLAVLSPAEGLVKVGFYRDPRLAHEWREQTVVRLLTYDNASAQMGLRAVRPGEPVFFDSDESLSFCPVYYKNYRIGSLPRGFTRQLRFQGAAYAILDRLETETRDSVPLAVPFVRIYWEKTPTNYGE